MSRSAFRIVVFPETGGRWWTARGLEHDIAAQGPSVEAAVDMLLRITNAHIAFDRRHNREPLSAFREAPRVYWNAFASGTQIVHVPADWCDPDRPTRVTASILQDHPRACYLPGLPRAGTA